VDVGLPGSRRAVSDQQPKFLYDGISSAGMQRAAALFWSEWVDVEGCILRRDPADAGDVRRWLATEEGSAQRTEWALNHVHLYDEVEEGRDEPQELPDQRLEEVAQRLASGWRASLAAAFPSKTFLVEVVGPDEGYGPTVYAFSGST
jgi:hypothetical protein